MARAPKRAAAKKAPAKRAPAKPAGQHESDLRARTAYKEDHEPLSVPGELKDKMKRCVYGIICTLASFFGLASSTGVNPLCHAGPGTEGAFVALNLRQELKNSTQPYLFAVLMTHLHREAPPSVAEWARKKDVSTTPRRCELEESWMLDPVTDEYCEVHATLAGLQKFCKFVLTRRQQRTIFLYCTTKPARLTYVDLPALLAVLKPQLAGLNQHSTVADMCDILIAPFMTVFGAGVQRLTLRRNLDVINGTRTPWALRLAPLAPDRTAHAERRALIEQQETAMLAARAAAAPAPEPRSRSGKHKLAGAAQEPAPKKQNTGGVVASGIAGRTRGAAKAAESEVEAVNESGSDSESEEDAGEPHSDEEEAQVVHGGADEVEDEPETDSDEEDDVIQAQPIEQGHSWLDISLSPPQGIMSVLQQDMYQQQQRVEALVAQQRAAAMASFDKDDDEVMEDGEQQPCAASKGAYDPAFEEFLQGVLNSRPCSPVR